MVVPVDAVRVAIYGEDNELVYERYYSHVSDAVIRACAYVEAAQWENRVITAILITSVGSEYDPDFDSDSEVSLNSEV